MPAGADLILAVMGAACHHPVCRDVQEEAAASELERLRQENQLLKEMLLQERDPGLDTQACLLKQDMLLDPAVSRQNCQRTSSAV